MIDHITVPVKNLAASKAFYERVFKPLGYTLAFGDEIEKKFMAFDLGNDCLFEICEASEPIVNTCHFAFRVASKEMVNEFYEAAMLAGATNNGPPGPRPQYTEHYYACFIKDLDGYNVEVMLK